MSRPILISSFWVLEARNLDGMTSVAQLVHPNQPLQVSHIAAPLPGPGELLFKLGTLGICDTNLHVAEGTSLRAADQGVGITTPISTRLRAPWPHDSCDHCRSCLTGWEFYCPPHRAHGYTVNGSFAEYVIGQEHYVAKVPAGLDSISSVPLMYAGVTTHGDVAKGELTPGKVAVVMGCGGLGQYGTQIAKLTGATMMAIVTNTINLQEARRFGANEGFSIDAETADKVKALGGADTVLNFAPSSKIWSMATGMVNNFAAIVSVMMVAEPVSLMLEWLTYNGMKITGKKAWRHVNR
jgi:propanol-preferring alcohol dehydrogenase